MIAKISLLPVSVDFEERYELRKQLCCDGPHGGWLALDRLLGRQVLVSRPYRPDDNQWFIQMAQIRARLRHTNLVPLYDLGATNEGIPFFTEPWIEATNLRRLQCDFEGGSASETLARLVGYLLDACNAVAFLHANGFMHLALHPENVAVAPQFREVYVSLHPAIVLRKDLGAGEGVLCGLPAYMAPEQLNPQKLGTPDAATDVYGLGGILFAILYGKPPNGDQSTAQIVNALMAREGPPRRGTFCAQAAQSRELARKLEPVCLRALESDRSKRYGSVSAFVKEVAQCAWLRVD